MRNLEMWKGYHKLCKHPSRWLNRGRVTALDDRGLTQGLR